MPDTKNPKGIVGYRVMTQVAARCGICAFWDPCEEECQIVGGDIEEDCVCDLFSGRRPNYLAGNPRFLQPPSSVRTIPPLDIPTLGRMDLYRQADEVRPAFVRKTAEGLLCFDLQAADADADPAWLQKLYGEARRLTGLSSPSTTVGQEGEPLLDLEVSGDEAKLVPHAPYRLGFHIAKQLDEKRYTLGPLYLPDTLDAHGDFVTSETLQTAAWNYLRNSVQAGSNTIYDQHTDQPAGEWVDLVTWPFEQTVKMAVPGQGEVERTFPAGTVYQGVIWSPSVWEQVKSGEKRGLSMGGMAVPSNVAF